MTHTIQLALIGCGQLGRIHAECIAKIEDARFSAYADVHLKAAEKLREEFGGDYATEDLDRIFNDPNIRAVHVCTQHDSHAELCIRAARAGKHVLVEKPLALNLADCEAIAEAVHESGVILMPAFKMRYYPLVMKAREFIPKPQVLVGQMMDGPWSDGIWAQDPIKGGANVHAQGCHTTDILRFLAGSEPDQLWATGGTMTHPGHPCLDQCVASIRFANGAVASWIQGDAGVGMFTSKFFLELFCQGKSVQLHDRLKKAVFFDGKERWTEERDEEEGFLLENREFISAIREDRAPALSVQDGIQATRMVLAADRSVRTGLVQSFTGESPCA